ncbi:hypothetical protein BPY_00020 [Bifidobacterium psychraerophilum]|uniref:hypothetical protein n=1 Tax=Bifidobacterium psychraerophilum TaxID=218140 RepID=UPI0031185276
MTRATTKKTTSPTVADFEEWNDELEEQALIAASKGFAVRHVLKDGCFWGLAPNGKIYKLPLALSIDDFERISNSATDSESIDGLKRLLTTFAPGQEKDLSREPIQVVMNLLTEYGSVIAKSQGADLGKSQASSPNSTVLMATA